MLAEAQRAAMLAAMGIDVYRLRGAAAEESSGAVQIFIDAQARVCVSGARDDAAFPWLPLALRVPSAAVRYGEAEAANAVTLEDGALPRDAAGKRTLWQALKPLARQLRNLS